jgi:methylated-DNA-protein-cysteine methyltransferase related protein
MLLDVDPAPRARHDRRVDEATVERVRAVVRAIPAGQVRSYGEVAEEAGLRSARLVGRILAVDGHDLPWHRVVRADGRFAPHLATEQAARLRVEGVLATDGRVPPPLRPCR